jgi:hypothetical protein
MQTWNEIYALSAVEDNSVPALPRLFWIGKTRGWSAEYLLGQMHKAMKGEYCPASFSKMEYNLAAVVYELGGNTALHALHKSPFCFPS